MRAREREQARVRERGCARVTLCVNVYVYVCMRARERESPRKIGQERESAHVRLRVMQTHTNQLLVSRSMPRMRRKHAQGV